MNSPTGTPQYGSPDHVAELVTAAAHRTPDQTAIVDVPAGVTLTWAEMDACVAAEAARLAAAGISAGRRVLVRLGNGAAFAIAVLGALRAGAIVVPAGPDGREFGFVIADAIPSVVVVADGDETARAYAADVRARVLGPPAVTPPAHGPEPVPAAAGGDELALLVYTSGITGVPRGVCLSHAAVLANRAQTAALRPAPVLPVDRILLALPLHHLFGLAAGLLQACWAGATIVVTDRFDAPHLVDVFARHRVSGMAGTPSVFRGLLDLPAEELRVATAGLRLCTSAGALLPPSWLDEFAEVAGLPIYDGYGLTEAGPVLTTSLGGRPKAGSVGRPLPGIELRLVDPDGTPIDTELAADDREAIVEDVTDPADDTGLVAVRGPNLFSGYWPDRTGGPDADGWFRTADVGFLDADGDLHLVDRTSDVVVVNGFSVYPREVEQVLADLAGLAEAAVVGVPDERSGEAVKAVVVRVDGAELTAEAVRAHCAEKLARFKVPTRVEFTDSLPRTPTGKIARRQLVRMLS